MKPGTGRRRVGSERRKRAGCGRWPAASGTRRKPGDGLRLHTGAERTSSDASRAISRPRPLCRRRRTSKAKRNGTGPATGEGAGSDSLRRRVQPAIQAPPLYLEREFRRVPDSAHGSVPRGRERAPAVDRECAGGRGCPRVGAATAKNLRAGPPARCLGWLVLRTCVRDSLSRMGSGLVMGIMGWRWLSPLCGSNPLARSWFQGYGISVPAAPV